MASGDLLCVLRWALLFLWRVSLVAIVCLGSGTACADAAATSPDRTLVVPGAQAATRREPPVQTPGPPMTTIRLKRQSFEDTQGLGGEAFALLMPVDWQAEGGVNWRLDRLTEDFCRHIRGVEGYYDPNEEKVVELPAGYDHVWANRGGEYVLTNDPNLNPNVGSNLEWQPIQPEK